MQKPCVVILMLAFLLAASSVRAGEPVPFRRGDGNGDGVMNLADSLQTLLFLFEGRTSSCEKALESNDDGRVDIGDASHGLFQLFSGGIRRLSFLFFSFFFLRLHGSSFILVFTCF